MPCLGYIDSACAITTFLRNFRFFVLRKSPKIPELISNSIHSNCMGKIAKLILTVQYQIEK